MGLRAQAAADAKRILEDASGFGWPIVLTSPAGIALELIGFSTDIGTSLDPETGVAVAGRRASVALSMIGLPELPAAVPERARRPWVVAFADVMGAMTTWKVVEVLPDRAIGVVVLLLEAFRPMEGPALHTGVLVLPRLQLVGSVSPELAVGGAVGLPPVTLAGAVTSTVATVGGLTLPALQLVGSVLPVPSEDYTGELVLPSLTLAGAMAPEAVVGGAGLELPGAALGGALTPAVALGGGLTLPSVALAGSVAPDPGEAFSGELTLPSIALGGDLLVGVAVDGDLDLPSTTIAAEVAPTVAIAPATFTLPSVGLGGAVGPNVTLAGALALPSLTLDGGTTPAAGIGGAVTLPGLTLAGGVTPTVGAVAGGLTLPSVALAGSVAPTLSLAGGLTLPSLTAAGTLDFEPNDASAVSSWLRVAAATVTGSGVSSLPDQLNTNPAVQATDARRPAVELSANGLPCMRFVTHRVLQWPLITANNGLTTTGFGFWVKPSSSVAAFETLLTINAYTGGASGFKIELVNNNGALWLDLWNASPAGQRRYITPVVLAGSVWSFVTVEIDEGGATELTRVYVTVGGVVQTLSISLAQAFSQLNTVTGNILLGNRSNTVAASAFNGLYGPNLYAFNSKMAGATQGLLTAAARLNLMNFEAPT